MVQYNPASIESKWQKIWADTKLYEVEEDESKEKAYITAMFPYPSGQGLHVGHVRNYSITDTLARYHRQRGYNVLSTIGWDAFGLPAENYAIKTGTPPAESTANNIVTFKSQLKRLGMSYDWSREINTVDPSYYKWTQWIFTQLFKNNLAYQAENLQWWCPECKTVLANEQVLTGGYCWRHEDTPVEKKRTKQWFFKITDYADELLDAIDELDWPAKIKTMQRNWIGRSHGAEITFSIDGNKQQLPVFTTRPDTLFGATFIVLAPEHSLIEDITLPDHRKKVNEYIDKAIKRSDVERMEEDRDKTGVFTGAYARNPLNNQKIPIWVADYVLMGYGTGAIMAVPAHDQRDYEFAEKYDLHINQVIDGDELPFEGEGKLINSGQFDGLESDKAREKITKILEQEKAGKAEVQYKMRDWLISRQRYWGAPIPIVYCEKDGAVAVPDEDLPVELPEVKNFTSTGSGNSILAEDEDWVNTTCPACGGPAKRETDTMDGYACSSWYLLRYTDAHNDSKPWEKKKADYWMPVDYYCGGDHAVSHLLYSRFWMRFFYDQGLVSVQEPVKQLVFNGYINAEGGGKMSKSKGNVVDPVELIDSGYGADSLRLYELFIAPYELDASWDPKGIVGTYRFLNRVWNLVGEYMETEATGAIDNQSELETDLQAHTHRLIKKVTKDLDGLSFNTAVAAMMEHTNYLYKLKDELTVSTANPAWEEAVQAFLLLLAPFAPHITEELWSQLGYESSIHIEAWPQWSEELTEDSLTEVVIQINGKVRSQITVPSDTKDDELEELAANNERIKEMLEGQKVAKTVVVPGKLVNFVTG